MALESVRAVVGGCPEGGCVGGGQGLEVWGSGVGAGRLRCVGVCLSVQGAVGAGLLSCL